jgi:aspartate-semialdehyde dehydrogenase
MSGTTDSACRVAIVGASTLRGKELKQVLEDRNFPASDFALLDESLAVGTLTEAAGEATFIRPIQLEEFERARFAFFAGSSENAAKNSEMAQRAGATVIDMTGALAGLPEAVPWIPDLMKLLPPPKDATPSAGCVFSAPATPTILACTLAAALAPLSPVRLAIVFFPPVSEHDQPGVDELESQTAGLLSFREISRPVFDAQVAFNLLASYGAESRMRLEDACAETAADVARYVAGRVPAPAIQMVQAPVFYGYAFSAYAELSASRDVADLEAELVAAGIQFPAASEPQPSNVSAAGSCEITLGRIVRDKNVAAGYWIWGVADNLRLAATNAVQIAEELLAE